MAEEETKKPRSQFNRGGGSRKECKSDSKYANFVLTPLIDRKKNNSKESGRSQDEKVFCKTLINTAKLKEKNGWIWVGGMVFMFFRAL